MLIQSPCSFKNEESSREWLSDLVRAFRRYRLVTELPPWAARAREIARDRTTEVVDVVFNNHAKGKAVVNALEFKKLLAGRQVPAPPTLLEAYPEALKGYARPVPPEALAPAAERRRAA